MVGNGENAIVANEEQAESRVEKKWGLMENRGN